MNKSLILKLSLFGLAMAFATVSIIPQKIEPACWIFIFIFCAFLIAKQCSGKYFLNGFLVSMVNCVWITVVHVLFYNTYLAHHPEMQAMSATMPLPTHPRLLMLLTGPIFGAVSGVVLGLFAFAASKLVKK